VSRTQNSKDQDATASTRHDDADMNSTMQILKRKDAKGPKVFLGYGSKPNYFLLFMVYRKKNRYNLNYENSKISPRNLKSDTT
jgi:hypothetical protein